MKTYKISNSRLDLYRECGKKFYYKHIEKLDADVTYSSLHFGKALDEALNSLLLDKKNHVDTNVDKSHSIFEMNMNKWTGQNEFMFFKNELPADVQDGEDLQIAAFNNLMKIGHEMIDLYVAEILPKFEEVIDVQIERKIQNEEGDTLTIILDFIAKYEGKTVLFDNKTSSDIKKYYGPNSVKKSQQLNLYSETFQECTHLGYIAIQKKKIDDKLVYVIVVDEPNEELRDKSFQALVDALDGIKDERFEKNEKNCFSFGRKCEYFLKCKYFSDKGLIKRE